MGSSSRRRRRRGENNNNNRATAEENTSQPTTTSTNTNTKRNSECESSTTTTSTNNTPSAPRTLKLSDYLGKLSTTVSTPLSFHDGSCEGNLTSLDFDFESCCNNSRIVKNTVADGIHKNSSIVMDWTPKPALVGFTIDVTAASSNEEEMKPQDVVRQSLLRLQEYYLSSNNGNTVKAAALCTLRVEILNDECMAVVSEWLAAQEAQEQHSGPNHPDATAARNFQQCVSLSALEELILIFPRGLKASSMNEGTTTPLEGPSLSGFSWDGAVGMMDTANGSSDEGVSAFQQQSKNQEPSTSKRAKKRDTSDMAPTSDVLRHLLVALRHRNLSIKRLKLEISPAIYSGPTTVSTETSQLDTQGIVMLSALIAQFAATLTALELPYCPLPSTVAPSSASLLNDRNDDPRSALNPLNRLALSIRRCVGLQVLDLTGSTCGRVLLHSCPMFLTETLPALHRLRALRLAESQLGDERAVTFITALHKAVGGWGRLEELDLSGAQLSPDCFSDIFCRRGFELQSETKHSDTWSHTATSYTEVDTNNNNNDNNTTSPLRTLVLQSNRINNSMSTDLAWCLSQCPLLTHLSLRHNDLMGPKTKEELDLAWDGLPALLSSLVCQEHLQTLVLSRNRKLSDRGVAALTQTHLQRFAALRRLDLSQCGLTSASLACLAPVLTKLEELQVLLLSENDLRGAEEVLRGPLPLAPFLASSSDDSATEATTATNPVKVFDPAYMSHKNSAAKSPVAIELERRDREEGRVRYRGDSFSTSDDTPSPSSVEDHSSAKERAGWPPLLQFSYALSQCVSLTELDLSDTGLGLQVDPFSFAPLVEGTAMMSATNRAVVERQRLAQRFSAVGFAIAVSQLPRLKVLRLQHLDRLDGAFLMVAFSGGAMVHEDTASLHQSDVKPTESYVNSIRRIMASASDGSLSSLSSSSSATGSSLRELRLRHCSGLGDVGLLQLCETTPCVLERIAHCRVVDLGGCGVTQDGWEGLLSDFLERRNEESGQGVTAPIPLQWEELWLDGNGSRRSHFSSVVGNHANNKKKTDQEELEVMSEWQQQRLVTAFQNRQLHPKLKFVTVFDSCGLVGKIG